MVRLATLELWSGYYIKQAQAEPAKIIWICRRFVNLMKLEECISF